MKVLVFGGTGAMGVYLVQLLSDNGIESVVTTRRNIKSEGQIKYIQGNAHDIRFLKMILQTHWDAIIDFMVYNTDSFKERVHILLDATSQYVFLSSARVYANSNRTITEDSPRLLDISEDEEYLATDEYALTKARQEDILRNSIRKNWTIIRPYITYSENRLQLGVLEKEEWLYRALKGRTIVFSSDINEKITTLTYGLDVAKGIMAVIGNPNAFGECFHVTTGESYRWKEISAIYLDVIEKHLGYKPKVLLNNMIKFTELHPAKYQIIYDRLYNRQFDNSKIARLIDTSEFVKINEGLKNSMKEFIKNPRFNTINWKAEALKDREAKEHTPLKEIQGGKQKIKYITVRYLYIIYKILKQR